MAMSLAAGYMVDRVGLKTCVFLFLSFCLVGSALFGLSFTLTSLSPEARYIMMFVGRFIFGLGGGSITIAQNAITAHWFRNRELAMAFGCTLTISRIGSVVNFNLTGVIFNYFFANAYNGAITGKGMDLCGAGGTNRTDAILEEITQACQSSLGLTFWIGSGLVGLSFMAAVFWLTMHLADLRNEEENDNMSASLLDNVSVNSGDDFMGEGSNSTKPKRKVMQLSDIKLMPITYWLVVLVICMFYCIIFPFMSIAPKYLTDAKGIKDGGPDVSLVYLMSAIISPFLGRAVDYFGRRGYLAILSTSLTIPVFLLLEYTDVNVKVSMVLLGLSYCGCAATLWPTVQMLVDEHVVGSANGIATCVQMLGIGLCDLAVGHLMDSNKSDGGKKVNYNPTLSFFLVLSSGTVALSVLLKCLDTAKGGKLYKGQRDKNQENSDGILSSYEDMMSPGTAVGNLMSPSAAVAGISNNRRNI